MSDYPFCSTELIQLTQNFRKLIIAECKFCGFDQYLATNPDFEFPKITTALYNSASDMYITIPGLFGGFNYFLEQTTKQTANQVSTQADRRSDRQANERVGEQAAGEPILYVEQSSRMYRDGSDYSYFAITASGSRLLKGEERENIHQKFQQFAKRAYEKRMSEIRSRAA